MIKNSLKCFVFSVFFIVYVDCFAQLTIFERNSSHNYEFSSANQSCSKTQIIISEVAKANQKGITATIYQIDFKLTEAIRKIDSLQYKLYAEIKDVRLKGDVFYRHMNIEHLLMPQLISYDYVLYRKNAHSESEVTTGNVVVEQLTDNLGYYTILNSFFQDSLLNMEYRLKLDNISFSYGEQAINMFMQTIKLIDEYYRSDKTLDDIAKKLSVIDAYDLQRTAFNQVVIQQIEKEIQLLQQKQFQHELQLWKTDPIGFSERIEQLERQSLLLKTQIRHRYTNLDRLYFEEGIRYMGLSRYDSAMVYFWKAIEFNRVFVPALSEKAYIEYKTGLLDTAVQTLNNIYNVAVISTDDRQRLYEVSKLVVNSAANSISKNIDKQDFVIAIQQLSHLEKLCSIAVELHCIEHIQTLNARSKHGMYRSYLTVVEKAIENKRFEIAKVYIEAAIEYQKENSLYILNSSEAITFYQEIVYAASKEIDRLLKRNDFEKSIELVLWLETYCNSQAHVNCSDLQGTKVSALKGFYRTRIVAIQVEIEKKRFQIADRLLGELEKFVESYDEISIDEQFKSAQREVKMQQYQIAIQTGLKNKEHKFVKHAFEAFLNAYRLQYKYELIPSKILQQHASEVATVQVPLDIQNDLKNLNSISYTELLHKVAYYDTVITYFQIGGIERVNQGYNELVVYKKQLLCDSISKQYINGLEIVRRYMNDLQFISSKLVLDSIQRIRLQYEMCDNVFRDNVLINLSSLQNAIEWEHRMTQIDTLFQLGEYQKLLIHYKELLQFINLYALDEMQIPSIPIEEFIWNYKNSEFLKVAFDFFYAHKQYDEAFQILIYLQKSAVPAKNTIDMQKKIGQKLAIRDKIIDYHANFKVNILKYTDGEQYFLYFSQSYRRTWKKH